ncbi:MAG: PLP-dependent aspartate aminotransferase family protein [Myxococcota bacterium]
MSEPPRRAFATEAVHAGDAPDAATGALDAPIVQATTYAFADADDAAGQFAGTREGYIYGRWRHPNGRCLEAKVAALEGAEACVAVGSGMAAIHGVFAGLLEAGDEVVAPQSLYAETARLLATVFARFGVRTRYVDLRDLDAARAALSPRTKIVWAETPANPVLDLLDLEALAALAHGAGALLVVDGTFATPYHQRALAFGADLSVHAATKALAGHGDAVAGVVSGRAELVAAVREAGARSAGAAIAPFVAWLVARGLKTLPLRQAAASANAAELAARLEAHPAVAHVRYPGLGSHPQHALARRQMERGFGSLVAFELAGGEPAGRRLYDGVALIARAVSLGDLRSLLTFPAATTHASMAEAQREAAGIGPGLLRLSVGVEDVEDLWRDLDARLG